MVKQLISSGEQEWKKQALRLEMAVRKENYDKSVAMYEQLKELIEDAMLEKGYRRDSVTIKGLRSE